MKDDRFPRHVYKKGGDLIWGHGVEYSAKYVENEEEFKSALKAGYIDDFNDALFSKVSKKKEEIKVDDDF